MQNLEIISVNLWQILISLCNLLLLFLAVKKFLFQPVKKIMDQRRAEVDAQYAKAAEARQAAEDNREAWEAKMDDARDETNAIVAKAVATANMRGSKIVSDARDQADSLLRQANYEIELERKKAVAGIRQEIVDVSAVLAEKMLEREIRTEDHHDLIDAFIQKIGDADDNANC
jgi:F-type H+-transporting ATPase subunit b